MSRLADKESVDSGAAFKQNPLGRYGSVKEIADGTVYIFSDAGNYVNGEVLVIDGGQWRSPGGSTLSLLICHMCKKTRHRDNIYVITQTDASNPTVAPGRQYPDFLLDDTYTSRKGAKL